MQNLLFWIQIASAVLLTLSILLQHKSAGLSATFGGGGNTYSSKRGLDRILVRATVVFAIIFFVAALGSLFI
jgi:protein translocase SecG subunit